jgi:hypothetical protein
MDKTKQKNHGQTLFSKQPNDNNFLFAIVKNNQKDGKKPQILNKGFIMDKEKTIKEESEDKISRINDKVSSMIKNKGEKNNSY